MDVLSGFITMKGRNMKDVKIITLVCEKHFPILRYSSNDMIQVKRIFNKLNYRYGLGETWFVELDKMVFSMSFNLFNWVSYRGMIFNNGISKEFRDRCVKDRCGSFILKPNSDCRLMFKFNEDSKNVELKSSINEVLFKPER